MSERWLEECQASLEYRFHDTQLLKTALTHSSKKSDSIDSNERLEFLGDAVLGFIISEHIFKHHPRSTEGDMTRIKSVVVSRRVLAEVSEHLRLGNFMRLGKGIGAAEGVQKKSLPVSLLANVFEAIIGAIYLDGGIDAARRFILRHLADKISKVEMGQHEVNFKSLLQQYAQRELGGTPTYSVIKEEGPDHFKQFYVVAIVNGKAYASACGRSKKEAEQHAAELTLRSLLAGTPLHTGQVAADPLGTESHKGHDKPSKPIEAPPTPQIQ